MSSQLTSHLNALSRDAAIEELRQTCGSTWWCERVADALPADDEGVLKKIIEDAFDAMPDEAWLEALASHPRIGATDSKKMKAAGNRQWSAGEQAGVNDAEQETLARLRRRNDEYYERFGYIFVVCATGKSAAEMLAIVEQRLGNDPGAELRVAAAEQRKITRLRLEKLAHGLA